MREAEYHPPMAEQGKSRGAGGTSGGLGEFFGGCAMALVGFYLLTNQIHVSTSFWHLWGYNTAGISLLPFAVGVGFLFGDGRSKVGWLLTVGALLIIVSGVLVNLHIYFARTSLWNTLAMLFLIGGGIGLVARSLRAH